MKRVRSKKGRIRELRIATRYTEWAYYRECPEMTNNYKTQINTDYRRD